MESYDAHPVQNAYDEGMGQEREASDGSSTRSRRSAPTGRGRPRIPAGYGIDTTAEGLLPWSQVAERMAGSRNYWVGTTRPDGRPHAAPVWGIWLDETFYFATDPASRKARNLAGSPQIVVHLESGDDVVILEGTAHAVGDLPLLARFADAYEVKYGFRPNVENAASGIYSLMPSAAYAWIEQDFPKSATRWTFS